MSREEPDKRHLGQAGDVPAPDRRWRTTMEEVVDIDRYRPSGLTTADPVLLGPEELHVLGDLEPPSDDEEEMDEIVHEFTWDRYPEGIS